MRGRQAFHEKFVDRDLQFLEEKCSYLNSISYKHFEAPLCVNTMIPCYLSICIFNTKSTPGEAAGKDLYLWHCYTTGSLH